jgi:hypothetical protein
LVIRFPNRSMCMTARLFGRRPMACLRSVSIVTASGFSPPYLADVRSPGEMRGGRRQMSRP